MPPTLTPEDIERLTAKSWADYHFLMGCYGQAIIPEGGFPDPVMP